MKFTPFFYFKLMEKKEKPKRIEFEGYCKRIRPLPNFKKLPKDVFLSRARRLYKEKYGKLEEEDKEDKFISNEVGTWLNEKEAIDALNLFNNYKKNYHLESLSDLELLKKLICIEVEVKRVHNDINEKRLNEENGYVPTYGISAIKNLTEQLLQLRQTLGLTQNKSLIEGVFKYIELLKKKFALKKKEEPNIPYLPCPYCKEALYIRLKDLHLYEAIKNPLFKGKILYNRPLLEYIKQKKLTFEEAAKVLETSADKMKIMFEKEFGIVDLIDTDSKKLHQ